jgi:Otopetrin
MNFYYQVSQKAPASFYQGFYLFLYLTSVAFVVFVYATHLRNQQIFNIIENYEERSGDKYALSSKKRIIRYGSFYLRVGAISFGIGSMVYSGLEFGQYFELKDDDRCQNILIALNPAARMLLTIVQMQFIFLNTKELNMTRNKVISRFGLMHLIATNLCEWIYVLVEETKHEIDHFIHSSSSTSSINHDKFVNQTQHVIHKRATSVEIFINCKRTNIMGRLVQNASPFLFPCTIEYSLICAVILYEMWKKIKMRDIAKREHQESILGHHEHKAVSQLSVDCSKAHRGMFAGILVTVITIISLIMFFVLQEEKNYKSTAVMEVTYCEILLYVVTTVAVLAAMYKMRDLKYLKLYCEINLFKNIFVIKVFFILFFTSICWNWFGLHSLSARYVEKKKHIQILINPISIPTAQSGVYIYSMFSIIGCYYTMDENAYSRNGFISEILSLLQTSIQTIFILNAWWRRAKGNHQNRTKPGRELITFLLVANMAIWFINTLIKNRATFRTTHLSFFGEWSWTIITHTSMPLAIFYR